MATDLLPGATRGKTDPPDELNPAQHRRLEDWAEAKFPWIARGALGCTKTLDDYEEECLDWFRGKGRRQKDWLATVRTWIRTDERRRLNSPNAITALRAPAKWLTSWSAGEKAEEQTATLVLVSNNQEAPSTLKLGRG